MADPFTWMAVIGAGASVAGGVTSAMGQSAAGDAAAANLRYKAGVAANNAKIQRQNSDWALEAGGSEALRSGLTTGFTIAKQKVAQGAGGFDVNSGSNLGVRDTTRDIGALDQNVIRTNSSRRALGFRNQAAGLDAESGASLIGADNAKTASDYAVAGTLIGTAGSVASKWATASQSFGAPSSGVTLYDDNQQAVGWNR